MLAAVLTGRHQWRVDDVPVPATAAGEVLVRTEIAAICGSDLHAAADATSAQPPGYPGHEAVGTVNAAGQDVLGVVMRLTGGDGADLVIEAAGRDASRHQAMRMVAVEGRIGLFGVEEKPGLSTYPLAEVFRRRPTIEMTWGAQFEPGLASFAEAATLVTSGGTGISGLVSHQIPLDGIENAFRLAGDPQAGAIKVAITFGAG